MRPEPRLPALHPEQCDPETRRLLEGLRATASLANAEASNEDPAPGENLFAVLAHNPDLLRRWTSFGAQLLLGSSLSPRLREIAILRTGWLCGSEYEFGQHTLIGRAAGLQPEEIARLASREVGSWAPDEEVVIRATDELVELRDMTEGTWNELAARFEPRQILDLIFTVGQYVLVSTALRALRIPRESGVPGWPSDAGPSHG
ncbi:MAG: carboxymuconolactone decarboxylase [Acidimicrobiales bacterium]|nr:MAG: carboxymuconolactone decarboxylase [Acidimicrobiales bacterium]